MPGAVGVCHHCRKSCHPLRCARCRSAFYCSPDCQKAAWKAGHSAICGRDSSSKKVTGTQAQHAWNELQSTLMNISAEDAHQRLQIATAERQRLEAEQAKRCPPSTENNHGTRTEKAKTTIETVQDTDKQQDQHKVESTHSKSVTHVQNDASEFSDGDSQRKWIYAVEEMSNIACFRVTLRPSQGIRMNHEEFPSPSELDLSMKPARNGSMNVALYKKGSKDDVLLSVRLPARIVDTKAQEPVIQIEPDSICLRLESEGGISNSENHARTSIQDVNRLRCRFCDQSLLEQQPITKVLPLPSGYWDEITDYLICYNGQPTVDFASASTAAARGRAMEDSSVLVLHREDMGHSVCVLAVEGYGEEGASTKQHQDAAAGETVVVDDSTMQSQTNSIAYRGSRDWRESVGGATICCAQCCSNLGFASIESPNTFRLLKHRISAGSPENRDTYRAHTCVSFVGQELVRYAESMAIFTFVVAMVSEEDVSKSLNTEHTSANGQCLLLRILSWDSKLAVSSASCRNYEGVDILKFRNVVKVVYEETEDRLVSGTEDLTSWIWGGVDLCCLPNVSGNSSVSHSPSTSGNAPSASGNAPSAIPKNASVRLYLSRYEWNELLQSLRKGSLYVSQAVRDATILLKLGPNSSSSSHIGVSALPLL